MLIDSGFNTDPDQDPTFQDPDLVADSDLVLDSDPVPDTDPSFGWPKTVEFYS